MASTPPAEMVCANCGRRRHWPEDFPVRMYARCTECHAKEIHAETVRYRSWWRRLGRWLRRTLVLGP